MSGYAGYYVIDYLGTITLSKVYRESKKGKKYYYADDIAILKKGDIKTHNKLGKTWDIGPWIIDDKNIKFLYYGRTLETLKKKCPQYFI
jgi:hypothetical protein